MARPLKEGLDYFSLDCHFNDAMKLIKAEFGLIGVGIVVTLWQKIYGERGYYARWDSDVALVFSSENGVGVNVVHEVVSACMRRGIFDRDLFEQYGILTSDGIQKRYAEATARRGSKKIDGRYLLITIPSKRVIVYKNSVIDDKNAENVDDNPQSKVEESKVNTHTNAHARGKYSNVILTEDEYRAVCAMIPDADAYIDRFSEKLASRGYRYDDHYAAIMSWWQEDKKKDGRSVRNDVHSGGSFDTDDFFEAACRRKFDDL